MVPTSLRCSLRVWGVCIQARPGPSLQKDRVTGQDGARGSYLLNGQFLPDAPVIPLRMHCREVQFSRPAIADSHEHASPSRKEHDIPGPDHSTAYRLFDHELLPHPSVIPLCVDRTILLCRQTVARAGHLQKNCIPRPDGCQSGLNCSQLRRAAYLIGLQHHGAEVPFTACGAVSPGHLVLRRGHNKHRTNCQNKHNAEGCHG
mmetsp:Transcript_125041/g.312513  ORF Transcript_125041/g.312513 Transcript_125041/m.312513 type:complete len:203 (-) Transcript_125041:43-651(-)